MSPTYIVYKNHEGFVLAELTRTPSGISYYVPAGRYTDLRKACDARDALNARAEV